MADEPKSDLYLMPRRVTIEANLKFFSLNSGISSGSTVSIEFDIAENLSPAWVQEQIWREKEKLDTKVLTMEWARGSVSMSDHNEMRAVHRKAYDQILKRKAKDDSGP